MAYDAKILPVMIASPSDVSEERQIVSDALAEWNVIHSQQRKAAFLPVGWETHSSPELSGRPQQMINDRLLKDCDLLVGIFWTRAGSSTGKAISGSVEEITLHRDAGKPVLLYFSEVPVKPGSGDQEQWAALMAFKSWALGEGLVHTYESVEDFRAIFPRHLGITLRDNSYLNQCLSEPEDVADLAATFERGLGANKLSGDAEIVLKAAVAHDGEIMVLEMMEGTAIQAGLTQLDPKTRKEAARWKAAVRELQDVNMIDDRGYKGEIFEVNHKGFTYAETHGWTIGADTES